MSNERDDGILYRWRDLVLSEHGPPATRRHVLAVLSLHMDADGGNCYPSTRRLAEETGLSRRTVESHLRDAETEGWIRRIQRGVAGQGWKRLQYFPSIPDEVGQDVSYVSDEGGEADSPRTHQGGEPHAPRQNQKVGKLTQKGGEPRSPDLSKESPVNTSMVHDGTDPLDGEDADPYGGRLPAPSKLIQKGREYVYPSAFEEVWSAYPGRDGSNPKKGAYREWRKRALNGAKPEDLLTATRHYAEHVETFEARKFVKQASTFFGSDEAWRDFIEPRRMKSRHWTQNIR